MSSPAPNTTVTCMACRLVLTGAAARGSHYRSDLHRVNLQRKVAGVAALSAEDYAARAAAVEAETTAEAGRRAPRFCAVCSKKFSSESALANHVNSRRHRDAVRVRAPHMSAEDAAVGVTERPEGFQVSSIESEMDTESEDGSEAEMERRIAEAVPFGKTECVFDGRDCGSVEKNLKAMREFGFFLPFEESLEDVDGLLEYFGQKVGIGYACLECDRPFASIIAAQRHMVDAQHCRMTSDEEVWFEEYAQFYAFGDGDVGDDGWEEVGDDEAAALDVRMKEETESSRVVATADAEASSKIGATEKSYDAPEEAVEMVLGNKTVGHRSFQRYYKQNLQSSDTRDAVVINKRANELRVMGWHGKKMPDTVMKAKRMQAFKHSKRNLEVGMKNYYTRKAPMKVAFSVLNSGYVGFEFTVLVFASLTISARTDYYFLHCFLFFSFFFHRGRSYFISVALIVVHAE